MANHATGGDWPIGEFVGDTMSADKSLANVEVAVTTGSTCTEPFPAAVFVSAHFTPESFGKGKAVASCWRYVWFSPSALILAVLNILAIRSCKEMRRVDTRTIIAGMADKRSIFWKGSIGQLVGESMCADQARTIPE